MRIVVAMIYDVVVVAFLQHAVVSRTMNGSIGKIMKKHGANLCDIQVLVFRNKLLYIPKGQKRKIGLIRQYSDDMFDSQLIIDAHDKDYHTSRRDSLRVSCQL